MYFDRRLWALTQGFRGRIALAVVLGLLAAAVGIARFALLGWMLGLLLAGHPIRELAGPAIATAAAILLRGALE
jgi:ATP-binding cassette subfamily B protein